MSVTFEVSPVEPEPYALSRVELVEGIQSRAPGPIEACGANQRCAGAS